MAFINLGDILTFGFEYDGHPPGTKFVVTAIEGWYPGKINGVDAITAWKVEPLPQAET